MSEHFCAYCNDGKVQKDDLPCYCPSCGEHLTRLIRAALPDILHAQALRQVEKETDREVLDSLNRMSKMEM